MVVFNVWHDLIHCRLLRSLAAWRSTSRQTRRMLACLVWSFFLFYGWMDHDRLVVHEIWCRRNSCVACFSWNLGDSWSFVLHIKPDMPLFTVLVFIRVIGVFGNENPLIFLSISCLYHRSFSLHLLVCFCDTDVHWHRKLEETIALFKIF